MKENENNIIDAVKSELKDAPFKTVFKATLGFYVAQTFVSLLGLLVFGLTVYFVGKGLFK